MFYGQIPVFVILPVTARIVLRANPCFRRFARNRPSCFTGKSQFSLFCP
ncbi:vitamin B12-binding protein [Ligilactobacillus ruminis]|uniref:Vitamin B12-binding protein n=1 Tax=Ligilactobacillus ruminis TaxID=1623 RepID=A0A8B2Z7Y8_9LACO|nr:vitamin B12-binding protein [Ligilactobacillus ruminis]